MSTPRITRPRLPRYIDITGQRFGRLIAVKPIGRRGSSQMWWLLHCDCGHTVEVVSQAIRAGTTRSCGCYNREQSSERYKKLRLTHGDARHGQLAGAYVSWVAMKNRCTNPKNPRWKSYGGRGITFDSRWIDYQKFLADMGPRPLGHTIERVDVDGNYEPANCVWLPREKNTRKERRISCQ